MRIFKKRAGNIMINKEENERISVTLSKELLKELDRLCKEECRNRSKMLEYILIQYLKK